MKWLDRLLSPSVPTAKDDELDELDEWARHHDDPRSFEGARLLEDVSINDYTDKELIVLWQRANKLVGQRAPADYGEFLAYGFIEGMRRERDRIAASVQALAVGPNPSRQRLLDPDDVLAAVRGQEAIYNHPNLGVTELKEGWDPKLDPPIRPSQAFSIHIENRR